VKQQEQLPVESPDSERGFRTFSWRSLDRITLVAIPIVAGATLMYAWLNHSVGDLPVAIGGVGVIGWLVYNAFGIRL